jgi:hypothetical protein
MDEDGCRPETKVSTGLRLLRPHAPRPIKKYCMLGFGSGGSPVFTEVELTAKRGGLTAEEYRWKTIRKWLKE